MLFMLFTSEVPCRLSRHATSRHHPASPNPFGSCGIGPSKTLAFDGWTPDHVLDKPLDWALHFVRPAPKSRIGGAGPTAGLMPCVPSECCLPVPLFKVWLVSAGVPCTPLPSLLRGASPAPKSRICGSGPTACAASRNLPKIESHGSRAQVPSGLDFNLSLWLEQQAASIGAYARAYVLVSISVLLLSGLCPRRRRLRVLQCCVRAGCPARRPSGHLLLPSGHCAVNKRPPLPWSQEGCQPLPQPRRATPVSRSRACLYLWSLLMMNLPVLITAMPTPGIPHATAREASELTEGAAHTFDHLLPSQWPDVLPMPPPAATQTLGLQVLAPNYQPLYMQIPIRPDHEEGDILVLAAMEASEGYHFSFNQITPALPQPIDGYATVVASTLGMALIDQAVVILDLLRASGNRFAVALPTPLAYGDLLGYIRPLCDPVDLSLFVGQSLTPHPVGQDLVLADGLVIQALPHGCRPAARRTFAALLQAPGTWGAADQFPRPLLKAGICLLSEGRRFFLNKREYPGQPCEETAANCIGCPPGRMQLKVARPDAFANLSMHGHPCKGLACGLPIPPAPLGDREDNIAFFDLRPLGLKPLSHFQVGRVRHVHTVLRSLDVSPPQGYTLRDDDHRVEQGFVTTETGACLTVSLALRSPSPGPRKTGRQAEMREVIQTSTPIPPTAGRLRVNWQTWMPDQPLRSHRTGRGAALPGATEQPGAALRLSRALPMHCLGGLRSKRRCGF